MGLPIQVTALADIWYSFIGHGSGHYAGIAHTVCKLDPSASQTRGVQSAATQRKTNGLMGCISQTLLTTSRKCPADLAENV